MKVFEFGFEVDYGGGIMLIAAPSIDEAIEYVNKNFPSRPFAGYWQFSHELYNLTANCETCQEITSFTRVE
jgi:hypothetical protein